MAARTKARQAGAAIARRARGMVSQKRYEAALRAGKAAGSRARQTANERLGVLVGCATSYVVGKVEAKGKKLPTFGGVEGTALWGAALAFGPSLLGAGSGRLGQIAAEGGASLLGIACYKAGKGIAPVISGDDSGWE